MEGEIDAVVVDCYHSLRLCGDRMKMSLPTKKKIITTNSEDLDEMLHYYVAFHLCLLCL